jgi:hypothetical protein
MVRPVFLMVTFLVMSPLPGSAKDERLGTAPQHEEWTRKFTASGSTTRATRRQEGEAPGEQHPDKCRMPQILFEMNPADQWRPEPCA